MCTQDERLPCLNMSSEVICERLKTFKSSSRRRFPQGEFWRKQLFHPSNTKHGRESNMWYTGLGHELQLYGGLWCQSDSCVGRWGADMRNGQRRAETCWSALLSLNLSVFDRMSHFNKPTDALLISLFFMHLTEPGLFQPFIAITISSLSIFFMKVTGQWCYSTVVISRNFSF